MQNLSNGLDAVVKLSVFVKELFVGQKFTDTVAGHVKTGRTRVRRSCVFARESGRITVSVIFRFLEDIDAADGVGDE